MPVRAFLLYGGVGMKAGIHSQSIAYVLRGSNREFFEGNVDYAYPKVSFEFYCSVFHFPNGRRTFENESTFLFI
jgi:hypothetical protein